MALEIERKFLVKGNQWRSLGTGVIYCQGYLPTRDGVTVRVRIADQQAYLTIKGPTQGTTRAEFEHPIPIPEAQELLKTLCERPLIEKIRYQIPRGDVVWEVDEFQGENQGLILAEVELSQADQSLELPDWIGEEVSHDPRYFNANLVKYPFREWGIG